MNDSFATCLQGRPALLVAAHPGHELRVHGWVELARPEVWVLTNGAGHGEVGRLRSSAAVLEQAGATVGPCFGPFTDREAYALLLTGDAGPVAEVAWRLAARLVAQPDTYVVADAMEGFNPVHDLCRIAVDTAAALAEEMLGRPCESFDYPLEARPDCAGDDVGDVRLLLDREAVERKLVAARAYPEMAAEVARALAAYGEAAFAVERLRRCTRQRSIAERVGDPPLYERFGEERVAAGHYRQVLRLREHFLPFVAALDREARRLPACASC